MEKNIYYIPCMSVEMLKQEDVICSSADTDVPFRIQDMGVSSDTETDVNGV